MEHTDLLKVSTLLLRLTPSGASSIASGLWLWVWECWGVGVQVLGLESWVSRDGDRALGLEDGSGARGRGLELGRPAERAGWGKTRCCPDISLLSFFT